MTAKSHRLNTRFGAGSDKESQSETDDSPRGRLEVLVVQHVACETPGQLTAVLRDHGLRLRVVRPFRGEAVPARLGKFAGLVILGGPMGVQDERLFPFLKTERRLLEDALRRERPVLGICLGSQLLASVLGVPVVRGVRPEIGWHQVTLARAAARDGLWAGLPARFQAFHWHGDVFELPRGGVNLAWSGLTDQQAFRYGENAYGLLFHLEVTATMIRRMTRTFRAELDAARLDAATIARGAATHLAPLAELGRTVFSRWAHQVAETGFASPPALGGGARLAYARSCRRGRRIE